MLGSCLPPFQVVKPVKQLEQVAAGDGCLVTSALQVEGKLVRLYTRFGVRVRGRRNLCQ
jgi:hypothetical protein